MLNQVPFSIDRFMFHLANSAVHADEDTKYDDVVEVLQLLTGEAKTLLGLIFRSGLRMLSILRNDENEAVAEVDKVEDGADDTAHESRLL